MSDGQLHAIVGDDDFLVRLKAKEVFDSLLEHYPDDLSREIVDGRADRVEDAQRILKEGGAKDNQRIQWAWRTVTSRRPEASETQVVVNLLRLHEARFSDDLESAQKLIAYGESSPEKTILPRELASWTLVANLLLNLDEVVNKN